jgi:pyridoxine kinase
LSHNHQKKIAVINDLSGFGRCSIAVALPLISHLGVQCCPLPTAIFSNHTGFPSFYFDDYTASMRPYMDEWEKLGLEFEGILTGFLGSAQQIDLVEHFLQTFTTARTQVIIDPVMGDNGRPYATYTPDLCRQMKRLVAYANILTPNVTEACILTDTPYQAKFSEAELLRMAERLCAQGPEKVVITGVARGEFLENYCYTQESGPQVLRTRRIAPQRSGTGDVFSSIVAAGAVQGVPFRDSVKTAADFIKVCLKRSAELDIPTTDGVCFEEVLGKLHFNRS